MKMPKPIPHPIWHLWLHEEPEAEDDGDMSVSGKEDVNDEEPAEPAQDEPEVKELVEPPV